MIKQALWLSTLCALLLTAAKSPAALSVLHSFGDQISGRGPDSAPTVVGAELFGVTPEGGAAGTGVIYRISKTGAGYSEPHGFDPVTVPLGGGSFPSGGLVLSEGLLYGVTQFGGAGFDGVLFSIGANGLGYSTIHEFDMSAAPAVSPAGGVTPSGGLLYGSTLFGSPQSEGALYSVDPEGAGFSVLHSFSVDGLQGAESEGPVTIDSGALYGVASFGGANDSGVLYRYDLTTPGFSVLHDFGGVGDGATPVGGVLADSGALYGVALEGGASGQGALYRIDSNGTGYQTLHDFAGGSGEGAAPVGGLTLIDGRLFGVTQRGGPSDAGTVYSVETDGTGYRLHHAFSGIDGSTPLGGLTFDGTTLFGTASAGGDHGAGVLFALDPLAVDGDYNRDGLVNAIDYTVWRDALDSTTDLAADGDFSGVVDQGDYAVWAANYGAAVSQPAVALPEPGSAWLLGAAVTGWSIRRRTRASSRGGRRASSGR